jgi:hypothetical protein
VKINANRYLRIAENSAVRGAKNTVQQYVTTPVEKLKMV